MLPVDAFTDAQVLMDLPELYHYGREKYWFSMKDFYIYMFDGLYQVRFLINLRRG